MLDPMRNIRRWDQRETGYYDWPGSHGHSFTPRGVLSTKQRVVYPQVPPLNGVLGGAAWRPTFSAPQARNAAVAEPKDLKARPQIVNGQAVWPEFWGITRAQCLDLWLELRKEVETGKWEQASNVYKLVDAKIIPQTRGKGYGYALLLNKDEPREVTVMVSHAWSENALEFLESICRSSDDRDVLFICAFSIYQCQDGVGPSIEEQLGGLPEESPFKRVLDHIHKMGHKDQATEMWYLSRSKISIFTDMLGLAALCMLYTPPVLDGVVYTWGQSAVKKCVMESGESECHYEWVWEEIYPWFRLCLPLCFVLFVLTGVFRLLLHPMCSHDRLYNGRMMVVPNRYTDLYDRLWCVYEIFIARKLGIPCVLAQTMALAGSSSVEHAKTSNKVDEARLRKEIREAYGEKGYEKIDSNIGELMWHLKFDVFRMVCFWGFPVVIYGLAYYNIYDPKDCRREFWGDAAGLLLVVLGLVVAYYWVFKRGQGISPAGHLILLAAGQIFVAAIFELLRQMSVSKKNICHEGTLGWWAFLFGFSKAVRMGAFAASLFSLAALAFTWCNSGARAFYRTKCQVACFLAFGVCMIVARATVIGQKRIPLESWLDFWQAVPEAFYLFTEFMAMFGCPVNAIWSASLFWGLLVDWDNFWEHDRKLVSRFDNSHALLCTSAEDSDDDEVSASLSPASRDSQML